MSISDVSKTLNISWIAVKEIELKYLRKKYNHINLSQVTSIGIDEWWTGSFFLTIVRDMSSGKTLFVAKGKDGVFKTI